MAKRQGVVTWNLQDIRRVSAESMVDARTIKRALAGEAIRTSSKSRIWAAAEKLKLRVPWMLAALAVLGCSSSSQNGLFEGSGGAAGSGGEAGALSDSGAAGATGEIGAAGAAEDGEAGIPPACGGNAGGFMGCEFNGCNVCTEKVVGYPNYWLNHPACTPLGTCLAGLYGACNDACPEPSEADK